MVGGKGIKLLDNKLQRIAIIRAFFKNLKNLFFNKAISVVNNITEKLIHKLLKSWGKG